MKLGQRCSCPLTGVRGTVVSFRGRTAIARGDDGTIFKAKQSVGRPRKKYLVRVLDEGEILTDWIRAVRVGKNGHFALFDHPIFAGAELDITTLEVREDDA